MIPGLFHETLFSEVKRWLKNKDAAFYQTAFVAWKEWWIKCISCDGSYIE